MNKFLKVALVSVILARSINAAIPETDTTALQTLRNVCGTYFGATVPLSALTTITDAQINTKLPAADLTQITALLSTAATFFDATTLLSEITTFQARIQTLKTTATTNAQTAADVTAIGNMNATDLITKIGTVTTSTDTQIVTAIGSRVAAIFNARSSNQNKTYYSDLMNLLKAAQAKFTADTTYTEKILRVAFEAVGFETDKITALKSIFSDTAYVNYAKTMRVQ